VENDVLIDSIPLSEIQSIAQFDETSNDANHHAEEDDSSMNQFQSLMARKKSMSTPVAVTGTISGLEPPKQVNLARLTTELEPQASTSDLGLASQKIQGGNSAVFTRMLHSKVMQIKTDRDGHNSGRTYYLRVAEHEDLGQIIARLSSISKISRKKAENKSKFEKQQLKVRRFYNSAPFQYLMAALIFGVMNPMICIVFLI
jgi:hypothetical protein